MLSVEVTNVKTQPDTILSVENIQYCYLAEFNLRYCSTHLIGQDHQNQTPFV